MKILASVAPSMVELACLDAGEIDDRHDAAHDGGKLNQADLVELGGSSGISDAPNVTVRALICLMPPPEPID